MKIRMQLGIFLIALLVVVLSGSAAWADSCNPPNPPRGSGSSWWSSYASWCSSCCGTPNKSSMSCNPGSNWGCGRGKTTTTPEDQTPDWQQRQWEEEQELKEAEEEAKRRKEEAEERFKIDQEKALKSLKGTGTGTVDLKSSDDVVTPFGIKGSPPEEIRLKGMGRPETSGITSAWRQLHCGASISGYALKEANKKKVDYQEVHFLVEEAGKALDGGALRVECAKPPPPPGPYGKVKMDGDSPLVGFYKKLLSATDKETDRLERAEERIQKVRFRKEKAGEEVKKKEEEVERLKAELKEGEKPSLKPIPPKEAKPGKKVAEPGEDEEKKRALEEALAALKKAKEALAGVDETIQAAEKDRADTRERLGQYEDMFNKVQADPSLASSYMDKTGK